MQTAALIEEPITIEEAAQFLKMPVSSLRTKIYSGEVPHMKPGRRLLFLKSQLLAYVIKSQTNQ